MAELQAGESRTMIDSVIWAQYINVTNTETDRQPRRHNKGCANALRRTAKNFIPFLTVRGADQDT